MPGVQLEEKGQASNRPKLPGPNALVLKFVRICLVYVLPMLNAEVYGPAAKRWSQSYMDFPPGETDHEIVVCLNGGNGHGPYQKKLFEPLPVTFFEHNNWGKDIGAFQMAAEQIPCDLLVCMGSFVHFHQAGWLDRMVHAFEDNGPTVYGAWGFHLPSPHLRTTAFWMPPDLLNAYPTQIGDRDRYGFEHGGNSLTLWSQRMGFEPLMVTWNGVFDMPQWHHVDGAESLILDQHCDRAGIK